ncbi:MAG TPA: oligosaccharide flippase family protein [Solirubrobacteraceae bacterium]
MSPSPEKPSGTDTRSIDTRGLALRSYAARGVLVNSAFDIGLGSLALIRGLVLAALLTRADYGVVGVLAVSLGALAMLKFVGISDKYIQQEEVDQELAFQRAFTVELLTTGIAIVPMLVALPIVAIVYGHWELVPPGLVVITVMIASALQAPIWVYYRRMHFVRQRSLAAIEPVVGFAVAIALAIAGAGYWALVLGVVAGAWSAAIAAIATSPYRLRWRWEPGSLKVYMAFSAPIFIAVASTAVVANGAAIATNVHLGLAGVGAVAVAATISAFTARVDDLVSGTIYPAICAVQGRLDLLRESFEKVNRVALMWAMPFGFGLALFAADLITFVIGEKWRAALVLLEITGVVAALAHIGFNWDDYFRARAKTVPIAVAAVASAMAFLAVGLPLLFVYGLTGLAIGFAAQAAVHLLFRGWYLSQMFEGFSFLRHAWRAILPTVPAVAVVLGMRQLETGTRTAAMAISELAVYLAVTVLATWLFEGSLIREAMSYLSRRGTGAAPIAG